MVWILREVTENGWLTSSRLAVGHSFVIYNQYELGLRDSSILLYFSRLNTFNFFEQNLFPLRCHQNKLSTFSIRVSLSPFPVCLIITVIISVPKLCQVLCCLIYNIFVKRYKIDRFYVLSIKGYDYL